MDVLVRVAYHLSSLSANCSSLVAGAVLEVIGWAGRLAAHYCPYDGTLNTMQISCLIMGPGIFYSCFQEPPADGIRSLDSGRRTYRAVGVDQICRGLGLADSLSSVSLDVYYNRYGVFDVTSCRWRFSSGSYIELRGPSNRNNDHGRWVRE